MFAPEMHGYYKSTLDAHILKNRRLRRNFRRGVFAATTFNMGPKTRTHRHRDHLNLAYGWCAITALGDFDSSQGGHLVLWDLHLVIQFTPGSTIFIPSALLEHSNLAINGHESRMSFTQYSAAGLFRWVEYGFKSVKSVVGRATKVRKAQLKKADSQRWKESIKYFPVV